MPKKTPNSLRGLAEVRSGQRPTLKQALTRVLTKRPLDVDGVMEALGKREWLPSSNNPRKYVGETLSKEKSLFVRGDDGLYRLANAPKKRAKKKQAKRIVEAAVVAPVVNPHMTILNVEVPRQFDRGLALLAEYTGKTVNTIIGEVLTACLRSRINGMLDAMKIPDDMPEETEEPQAFAKRYAETKPLYDGITKGKKRLATGRFEWTEDADAELVRISSAKPVVTRHGKKVLGEGGWPAVARELSEVLGHKLTRLAVFKHWQWLKDKPDYLKDLRKRAAGAPATRRVKLIKVARFPWKPEHDAILTELVRAVKSPRKVGRGMSFGWADIAAKFSARTGYEVSDQSCLTRWHRIKDRPAVKSLTNGKSHVPIDQVLNAAGVETVAVAQG